MKRKTELMTLTLLLLITAASCRKVEIDSQEKETFLTFTKIGFYPAGEPRFTYRDSVHQMCLNSSRGLFRIQTNIQDTFMNIVLDDNPYECRMVLSELDYYDHSIRTTDKFEFECSKKTDDKIWLWDGYTKTGIIISVF